MQPFVSVIETVLQSLDSFSNKLNGHVQANHSGFKEEYSCALINTCEDIVKLK